jgi:predicted cupin superfamily sugar epimerase
LQSDELWHFYDGSSIFIYIIDYKGELKKVRLGKDAGKENQFQITIEKNNWFAAELEDNNSFALVGCTVAPGFEFADFEIAKRDDLLSQYSHHKEIIERLSFP